MGDNPRRSFLYTMASVMGAAGACATAVPFVRALEPAADTVASGVTEFDVSTVEPGMMATVMWRGQPVFVVHRTQQMLESLYGHDELLRDPLSEAIPEVQADWMKTKEQRITRAIKPEFLVVSGVCTHLGCIPAFEPDREGGGDMPKDWPGGWHCACHGSNYDLSGRVFKGVPAPYNLFIPPYRYLDESTIRIG
ncbi:MAG: ubiquinol-cytochrome c reductase iron-sulfur subunit [Zetaproteobacteria bacterium]|nr:MAG: ubiquinol-cytochrome c reductase iron-sulfur subunit [Zetaproteobacteria bacterium]